MTHHYDTPQGTHTPGLWKWDNMTGMIESALPNLRGEYEHICDLRLDIHGNYDEDKAHLIAAAPEMKAELERELAWLQHIKPQITGPASVMLGFDQAIKYISQVLSHAKGERDSQ